MSLDRVEVIILAGGKGTRLRDIVSDVPKPMAPINGVPFLEVLIASLEKQGFKNFRLSIGYMAESIQTHFSQDKFNHLNLSYTFEEEPLGTGGAIQKSIQESSFSEFIVMNGDSYSECDFEKFISINGSYKIVLNEVEDASRYGSVEINKNNQVVAFLEKKQDIGKAFINSGIYFFSKEILSFLPEGRSSIETDVFPKLLKEKSIQAYKTTGKFIDIGIPDDYQKAQTYLSFGV